MGEDETVRRERSPGIKLLFAALIGLTLLIPQLLVFALVYDRQEQSDTAQASINAGWGGAQVVAGPVLAVPYKAMERQNETVDNRTVERIVEVERELLVSPNLNTVKTRITPQERRKSIYRAVLFEAQVDGRASFALPQDLARFGVPVDSLLWERAELRIGTSDSRGLTRGGRIVAGGRPLTVEPGKGLGAAGNQGFFAFVPWDGRGSLDVQYAFGLRGSRSFSLVPRGGQTRWTVSSAWPSPSFTGDFLPERRQVGEGGFSASYTIDKLALGQPSVASADQTAPTIGGAPPVTYDAVASGTNQAQAVTVGLIEPVDLYAKVNRAVKYGFLFIGFTFLAYLLFDVVGGARVAPAEYLLTGAGLVLFFVLLLAFAEVVGFTGAYLLASAAIIGLLTAYSAAVLKGWRRAGFMGALLVGLYAALFVLLNLEALSLLIGSVLLFAALAGVMFATRRIDWGGVGKRPESPGAA
jgi:inner membrane protein